MGRANGASVGLVVSLHTVMDSLASKASLCTSDTLALAARKPDTLIADKRLIAQWQAGDEFMCLRRSGRAFDIGGGGIEFAVTNVVAHAAVEEENVLRDHADLAAQAVQAYPGDVRAIDKNVPRQAHAGA